MSVTTGQWNEKGAGERKAVVGRLRFFCLNNIAFPTVSIGIHIFALANGGDERTFYFMRLNGITLPQSL